MSQGGQGVPPIVVPADPIEVALDLARTALLVIDMQNDFLSPGGYEGVRNEHLESRRRAIAPIQAVLAVVRGTPITVVHTREGYRPDLSDCPPNKLERSRRVGAEIGGLGPLGRRFVRGELSHDFIPELRPESGEIVVDKPAKCVFYATDLDAILRYRAITHLIFTGVATETCVNTSVRNANDRGFYNLVLEDACGSGDPEMHRAAIEMIRRSGGRFGCVSTSDRFVAAIQQPNLTAAR
jgi:nicotinamidase-related amidase